MASHAVIYLFAYVLPGAIGFFAFGIYTRILSPEEYAVYSVGTSLSFLIGNVAYGWIRFAVGRYQSESHEANFLPFVMTCFVAVTLLLLPVAFAPFFLVKGQSAFSIVAVECLVVAQSLYDITQEIRRARHQSMDFARANVIRSVLSFSCAVAGAFYFLSGAGLVLGISIGFMIIALAFLIANRSAFQGPRLSIKETKRFLYYGLPLALSGLVFSGNTTVSRGMVAATLGAGDAGRFGAALDVTSQIAIIIAASVSSILAPLAIKANLQGGIQAAQSRLADGAELLLAALVPATVGLMFLSHTFGDVMVGPKFEQAVQTMLPVLAVSRGIDAFVQFYLHLGFQIVERPLMQAACGMTTLVVNVIASMLLLPVFGVQGAVYGLLLGDIVGLIVSCMLLRTCFPVPIPVRSFLRAGFCSAIMAAACVPIMYQLGDHPVLSLIITPLFGVIVYGTVAYMLDVAKLRSKLVGAGLVQVRSWLA